MYTMFDARCDPAHDPNQLHRQAGMRRQDLAAIRWLEVTILRAGRRTAARYARYTQHEQPADSMDANVFSGRLGEFEDPDEILDLQRAFRNLSEDERKVLWFSAVEGWPQVRIASDLHLSQARVSQLRSQALDHIRALLSEKKGSR